MYLNLCTCCSVSDWLLCVFQGDIIDNIEQNVSKSVDHITVAKEQTKKAIRHQTKARKVTLFNPLLHQPARALFLFFFCLFSRHSLTHLNHTVTARPAVTSPITLSTVAFCVLRSLFLSLSLLFYASSFVAFRRLWRHVRVAWLTGLRATWTSLWALWSGP